MISAPDSGSSGLDSSPGLGHCVVFLGKAFYSLSLSLSTLGRVVRKPVNVNPGLNVN